MRKPTIPTKGPERIIQDDLVKFLELRDWHVMETHGNLYQRGFPDLYCVHDEHKQRWIEVKQPINYCFTPDQKKHFPKISKVVGIWILTAATEHEYAKLFAQQNWYQYLEVLK